MKHYSIDEMMEIQTKQNQAFQNHLSTCKDCHVQWEELNEWSKGWQEEALVPNHTALWTQVEAAITEPSHQTKQIFVVTKRKKISSFYINLGIGVAAAILLMSTGAFEHVKKIESVYATIFSKTEVIAKKGSQLVNDFKANDFIEKIKKRGEIKDE